MSRERCEVAPVDMAVEPSASLDVGSQMEDAPNAAT